MNTSSSPDLSARPTMVKWLGLSEPQFPSSAPYRNATCLEWEKKTKLSATVDSLWPPYPHCSPMLIHWPLDTAPNEEISDAFSREGSSLSESKNFRKLGVSVLLAQWWFWPIVPFLKMEKLRFVSLQVSRCLAFTHTEKILHPTP